MAAKGPKCKRAAKQSKKPVDNPSDVDDSESGSSGDDDDDDAPGGGTPPALSSAPRAGKKARLATEASAGPPPRDRTTAVLDAPEQETPILSRFSPPGFTQTQTAAVLLEPAEVQAAARCSLPAGGVPVGQQYRHALRYKMALGRLRERLGGWWSSGREVPLSTAQDESRARAGGGRAA